MVITHLCIPLVGSGSFQERHLVWMVIIVKIPHHSFCPQGPLTSRLVSRARSPVVLSSGPTHQSSCLQGPLTSRLVFRARSPVVLSSGPTHQSSCLQGPLTSRLVFRARSPVVLSPGPAHQSSCLQGPLTSRLVSRACPVSGGYVSPTILHVTGTWAGPGDEATSLLSCRRKKIQSPSSQASPSENKLIDSLNNERSKTHVAMVIDICLLGN